MMKAFAIGLGYVIFTVIAICLTPLLVWVAAAVALYQLYQGKKEVNLLKQALPNLLCTTDSDCPLGSVCLDGRCVRK